jgi:chromosomal replication initiation ATPase DnaA
VAPAQVLASRSHGNEARCAAIYLTRSLCDDGVVTIGRHFGGVSQAAVSKTVARTERRRRKDRVWDRRLATLLERLRATDDVPKS